MSEGHWGCEGHGGHDTDTTHAPECKNPPLCEALLNGGKVVRQPNCSGRDTYRYRCTTFGIWLCSTCHSKASH